MGGRDQFPFQLPGNVPKTLISGGNQKLHWHQLNKGKRDGAEGRGSCPGAHSPHQGLEPFLQNLQETVPTEHRSESKGRAHKGRADSELCPRGFLMGGFITTEFPKAFRAPSDIPKSLHRRLPRHVTGVPSLGPEDPLEEEMATHSSILAWSIQWTEKPGRTQSMGSQSWTQLSDKNYFH